MKKTTVLLPALALAVMASAAVPAQAEVVKEYPKQFCIEARCVTATHSLKAPVVEEPQVKALDKGTSIENVRLIAKTGGKSGDWVREGAEQ